MDGGAAQSDFRPGTKLFAPQCRLVNEDGTPLTIDDQPVSQDIVSATVTLQCSGPSQVEIVLNNQRSGKTKNPVVPLWRYNQLDAVRFGTRVRVDFRYGNDTWTPLILARVTDIAFLYPSATGAQLTLKGQDLLSLLAAKPEEDYIYIDFHEVDIVADVLDRSKTGLKLPTPPPQPLFAAVLPGVTHEKAKTYLQFIDSFAQRMDYEVFVSLDRSGKASMHFEPARSAKLDEVVELLWGRDIVDFKPTFKVWGILTEAIARGSVARGRGAIEEKVTLADAIKGDLHAASGGPKPMSAADARERAFDHENRPEANSEQVAVANLDKERARMQATAVLRKSAREFLTAEVTTLGVPQLKPGIHVNLKQLYAPFDGIYYVTQTVHSLSAAGYTTKTSLRRPGMLNPSSYPKG